MTKDKPNNEIIIYEGDNGQPRIEVRFENETVWLTQEQMAELFGKGRSTITEHIQNTFKEGELDEKLVCRDSRLTTKHGAIKGKTQEVSVKYYNLDVIISVSPVESAYLDTIKTVQKKVEEKVKDKKPKK